MLHLPFPRGFRVDLCNGHRSLGSRAASHVAEKP